MRNRVPDWQRRLRDVLARYRADAGACGVSDCGTLWADAVFAVSGVDTLGDLRGTYSTPGEAVLVLEVLGFSSAAELANARFEPVAAADLHRGDLGFAPSIMAAPLASPAIVDAGHAFTVGPNGLTAIPRALISHGWAV